MRQAACAAGQIKPPPIIAPQPNAKAPAAKHAASSSSGPCHACHRPCLIIDWYSAANQVRAGRISSLYNGAYASAFATMVGHYPWFTTYNMLERSLAVPASFARRVSIPSPPLRLKTGSWHPASAGRGGEGKGREGGEGGTALQWDQPSPRRGRGMGVQALVLVDPFAR